MMIFKSGSTQTDLNGFLDAGSHIQGDLQFENTFRIDGKFSGTIRSDGNLIVGEGGHVDGEVEVGQVFVSGKVEGEIRAHRRVQIATTGKVYGSLDTPALVVEDGALLEGRCVMSHRARGSQGGSHPEQTLKQVTGEGPHSAKGGKVAQMPLSKDR